MLKDSLFNFFSRYKELSDKEIYTVAVSGGPDSMALAHALIEHANKNNKKCHLLTVDHGLRVEAKKEADMVAGWAAQQGAVHHSLTWEGNKPDTSIMEAARNARYHIMADKCAELGVRELFIAHHQDDQAETFLIRLSKGSGLDGLAAMSALHPYNDVLTLIRPLLNISKADLVSHCDDNNIPYVTDPSNENDDYLRPRLRASMDVLEQEGLSPKRLATTASRLSRARRALEQITDDVLRSCVKDQSVNGIVLDFDVLKKQPEEIALRVIQKALEDMRLDADYRTRMEKLEELFTALWFDTDNFKPRTLGGCVFSLKGDKQGQNLALYIKKETIASES